MPFAEQEGWNHVHFHIVPRMGDFPEADLGPGTLRFVNRPKDEWVPESERERLAAEIGDFVRERVVDDEAVQKRRTAGLP